jgi:signal transduction histidine kinase
VRLAVCDEPDAPLKTKEAFSRIAQEALHNIVKHARATHVDVSLCDEDGALTLDVRDDGTGFNPNGDFPGHLGLRSMRERITRLGGTFEIESAPGKGTRIRASLPLVKRPAVHI